MQQVEDILRQLRENPDRLPVVALPPVAPRLNAESLSPNRQESCVDIPTALGMAANPVITSSVPPPAFHHSRSISLDGETVPNDPVSLASNLNTISSPPPLTVASSLLGPPAVTIDAATPPAAVIPAPVFPSVSATETPASNSVAVDLQQQQQQQQAKPAEPTKVDSSCLVIHNHYKNNMQ